MLAWCRFPFYLSQMNYSELLQMPAFKFTICLDHITAYRYKQADLKILILLK